MATQHDRTLSLSRVLQRASVLQIIASVIAILIIRWITRGFYRVYFHPLSRFPGPRSSAFTRIPHMKAKATGMVHEYVGRLHEQYGDVVRISPDELSFIEAQAWRDIYGHGTKGTRGSPPPKHWLRYGKSPSGGHSLINLPNDEEHGRMRRIFTSAFSDRALKQQEPLFMKYIDRLVQVFKNGLEEDPDRVWDIVRMYNFTTFDVMGDLTFGESLHMLEKSDYDPWVSIIFKSIKLGSRLSLLHDYPLLHYLSKRYMPKSAVKQRLKHFQYAVDRVDKRLEKGREAEGVDLWDLVLSQKEGTGLTRPEMYANSSLFMIAGTETTATLVSGLTYLLLKHPESMKKVVDEIRGAFSDTTDMHMERVAALPYLNACIREGMRRYPPVPIGLAHRTPSNGSTICGHYVPPGFSVAVHQYPMYSSPRNFKDPLSFVPERWLGDERFEGDQKAALQPFSTGTRDCLGKNMAYHEMRLLMAKVLYHFDIELCPENVPWNDQPVYTLWQKKPLMVKLKVAQH